jgi:hypothetical protein
LPADAPLTPDQLAQEILAKVDPSTNVSVETPGYVAGRPVYELVLAPKAAASTIDRVTVSVDAATGAPLSTAITAKGETSPAFEVGFTAISFNQPDASVFAFTPPAGATVTQADSPAALLGLGGRPGDAGGARRDPKDGSTPSIAPPGGARNGSGPLSVTPGSATPRTEVVGTDWTSVAIVKGVSTNGVIRSVLDNAQTVSGPAGTGRLVTTPLVNVLVLDDGRVVVGAVTPDALQAAAAP